MKIDTILELVDFEISRDREVLVCNDMDLFDGVSFRELQRKFLDRGLAMSYSEGRKCYCLVWHEAGIMDRVLFWLSGAFVWR